ncbi:hypothetical protein CSA56_00785 [candidate division KSB3 bacterium]|uniref:Glycosyltransferase 2-like domain-containing protein n=1 Tax=candidate division KSB3 bacterium TaxID=2044937 RepID=A0A2G6KKU4_9BACT|nr:MAG: hypothetical protein CSA56_00785 [candidate division KSB3 bacterium]
MIFIIKARGTQKNIKKFLCTVCLCGEIVLYTTMAPSSCRCVSVVMINWNGKQFLEECIRSIEAQSSPIAELLILDNCSTDGSQELLSWYADQHRVVLNETNFGYCGGANYGIRHTSGDYVLIMNPDVLLHPDFVSHLLETAGDKPEVGILSGKLLRFDKKTLDSTGQFLRKNISPYERGYNEIDRGQYDQPGEIFSCCGAVAFYRRDMLEAIQIDGAYFDEAHFAFYEDLDIGWRAQLLGWKAYYVPNALAYHYRGGGLSGQKRRPHWFERVAWIPKVSFVEKPPFIQHHVIVNRYLTMLKNASWLDIARRFPSILTYELLLWGYVLCVRPSLLSTLGTLLKLFPDTFGKRKAIWTKKVFLESECV